MKINQYYDAQSIEDAYEHVKNYGAVVLGGGAFLNLGNSSLNAAVDISHIGLSFIEERDGNIEIGAMTSLHEIETNSHILNLGGGIISETAKCIMGVQIRNTATIGGTVWGRYGFSDMLTSLLALETYVELYNAGRMTLMNFIESGMKNDLITKIIIKKEDGWARYMNFKTTGTNFSILNTAVSNMNGRYKIAVGARPKTAKLAAHAMEFINGVTVDEENAIKAAGIAAGELEFGSDPRGSDAYRRELCRVFVRRCIMEVAS